MTKNFLVNVQSVMASDDKNPALYQFKSLVQIYQLALDSVSAPLGAKKSADYAGQFIRLIENSPTLPVDHIFFVGLTHGSKTDIKDIPLNFRTDSGKVSSKTLNIAQMVKVCKFLQDAFNLQENFYSLICERVERSTSTESSEPKVYTLEGLPEMPEEPAEKTAK